MRRLRWRSMSAGVVSAAMVLASRAAGQSPDSAFFITTQGKDTIAIEQHVRVGNTITGAWIQHQGGVFVHDYALVLRDDGWPEHYVMTVYTTRPHTFLLSVTYGPDSATRIMVRDSLAATERVATQRAYPVGALSILGMELALARARQAHTDSSTIVLDRAEVHGPATGIPVRFFGGDSVRIGETTWGRVDQSGRLLALREGARETRRVSSFSATKLMAGFIVADSVAKVARVAIALPPAALQRFVGEYSLNPATVLEVTLDGDTLMVRAGKQPAFRLMPASPTTFFVDFTTAVTFEFETDSTGRVTALSLVQYGARQRAAKRK
jgi:uncharacterized protein DUF3471